MANILPTHADITVYTDVMEETSFPVGYWNELGVFVPVDLTGRALRFMVRSPNADEATILLDSDADASVCQPLVGDATYVYLKIPSNLTSSLTLGTHEYSVIDKTDAAGEGEVLIALGSFTVKRQAVR
jgi:hypothetical protein